MSDEFQIAKLFIVIAVFVLGVVGANFFLKRDFEKQFWYFLSIGLLVWSGIGGTRGIVNWDYLWIFAFFYLIFGAIFCASVRLLGHYFKPVPFNDADPMLNTKFWGGFVIFYLVYTLFPLTYPEMKLVLLVRPPAPDLAMAVEERFIETGKTFVEVLYYYSALLLFPFFLFSMHALGKRWWLVAFVIGFHYYTKYCINAYISRHEIGMALLLFFLYLWNMRIFPRQILLVVCAGILPPLLFFFNIYTSVRLMGGVDLSLNIMGIIESVITLFYEETFYPLLVNDLMSAAYKIDPSRYFLWILSLPIPQKFTAGWDYMRINREFTELMLGGVYGENIFTIILPGLVGEAIFIYGKNFWWIHTVLQACLMALICFLLQSDRRLFFLMTYFQLQALLLARGGGSMFIILVINYMILFWPFLFFLFFRNWRMAASHPMPAPGPGPGYGYYPIPGQHYPRGVNTD